MGKSDIGAIGALIAFIVGLYFAIPSQANIGYMIVDALGTSNIVGINTNVFKGLFNLLGVAIIIADIVYITEQFKRGNF